jgi:hypothetical protein
MKHHGFSAVQKEIMSRGYSEESNDIRDFFHAILSSKGFPCLTFIKVKSKSVSQKIYDSIDDLVNYLYSNIDTYVKDNVDIYFCISTLKKKLYIDDLGRSRSRTQENVLHTKVLVLDIDVDPSGKKHNKPAYRSIQEAKDGVDAFCAEVAIPNPYVICSGHGLHVYWPMQDCLPPEDWGRLANSLLFVANIVDQRLVVDPTRTKDCSGLLRVPGTVNFKRDYPSRVTIDATPSQIFWTAQDYSSRFKAYTKRKNPRLKKV